MHQDLLLGLNGANQQEKAMESLGFCWDHELDPSVRAPKSVASHCRFRSPLRFGAGVLAREVFSGAAELEPSCTPVLTPGAREAPIGVNRQHFYQPK